MGKKINKYSKKDRIIVELFLGILAVIIGVYLFLNNKYYSYYFFNNLNFMGFTLFVSGFLSIVDAILRIFNVIPIKRNKDEVNYEMIFFGILAVLIGIYLFLIAIFGGLTTILLIFGCILFVIGIFCIVIGFLRIIKAITPKKNADENYIVLGLVIGILSFLLGRYMLLNAYDWIFTIISLFIGFIIFIFGIFSIAFTITEIFKAIPTKKNIAKWNRDDEINEKYELKEIDEIKMRHKNYENKLTELSTKYGDITANITYYFESGWQFRYDNLVNRQKEILSEEYILSEDYFGDSFRKIEKSFIVFENSSTLFIENKSYSFKDIISFDVCDNSEKIYSGSSYSTTKTGTGSMIGRAVVGGALLGGAGAIIGGTTAKKESNMTISQSSYTIHKYEIIITVNSLSMPSLKLEIGSNKDAMQKISSILSIIIERNKL